jgi:DNA-binding transcriptional ArsR family regulator
VSVADVAALARLVAAPARERMLDALLAGGELSVGDLARIAGVTTATASEHLGRLRDGGLVRVVPDGRRRNYALASVEVAAALEAMALASPRRPARSLREAQSVAAMAVARTCYDHLAGRAGVQLHRALVDGESLRVDRDGYRLNPAGEARLRGLGVDVDAARARRRRFAFACQDVTEHEPHLAGALGAAVCERLLALGWFVRPSAGDRALRPTDVGRARFLAAFGRGLEV